MTDTYFVLKVVFYRSEAGNEPVREWLKDLNRDDRRQIGEDIKTAQLGWPLGMPLIKKSRQGVMGSPNEICRRHYTGIFHG